MSIIVTPYSEVRRSFKHVSDADWEFQPLKSTPIKKLFNFGLILKQALPSLNF